MRGSSFLTERIKSLCSCAHGPVRPVRRGVEEEQLARLGVQPFEGVEGLVDAVGGVEAARPGVLGQDVGALLVAAAVAGQKHDDRGGVGDGDRLADGIVAFLDDLALHFDVLALLAAERLVVVVLGPLFQAVESASAEGVGRYGQVLVVAGADQHEAERVGRPQPEVDRHGAGGHEEEQPQHGADLHAAQHARARARPFARPSRPAGRPKDGWRRRVRRARSVSAAAGCCWAWRSRWEEGKETGRLRLVCTAAPPITQGRAGTPLAPRAAFGRNPSAAMRSSGSPCNITVQGRSRSERPTVTSASRVRPGQPRPRPPGARRPHTIVSRPCVVSASPAAGDIHADVHAGRTAA